MGGKLAREGKPQTEQVRVSWGRIKLPPITQSKSMSTNQLEHMFKEYESLEYHVLWQADTQKGTRYLIDVDCWPQKGTMVFLGVDDDANADNDEHTKEQHNERTNERTN